LPVVVAVIRPAVGLNDGPVGEISENEVGRIFDAVLFWALVPPPRGVLPPLMIACPPMS